MDNYKTFINELNEGNKYLKYEEVLRDEKELEGSSDRGIVLICCSIIEELLKELIQDFLIDDKKSRELFSGNGPLANAKNRVDMAYYLGLISENTRQNIVIMQRIRNKFAHRILDVSFKSNDIINQVDSLQILPNMYIPNTLIINKNKTGIDSSRIDTNPLDEDISPKEKFLTVYDHVLEIILHSKFKERLTEHIDDLPHERIMYHDKLFDKYLNNFADALDKLIERKEEIERLIDEAKESKSKAKAQKSEVEKLETTDKSEEIINEQNEIIGDIDRIISQYEEALIEIEEAIVEEQSYFDNYSKLETQNYLLSSEIAKALMESYIK